MRCSLNLFPLLFHADNDIIPTVNAKDTYNWMTGSSVDVHASAASFFDEKRSTSSLLAHNPAIRRAVGRVYRRNKSRAGGQRNQPTSSSTTPMITQQGWCLYVNRLVIERVCFDLGLDFG